MPSFTRLLLSLLLTAGVGIGARAQTPPAAAPTPGVPANLRVEYRVDPIGIDEPAPRFSWEYVDPRRGAAQSAYRVLVAESREDLERETGTSWDSGRIALPDTNQITYAGRMLLPWHRYVWTVHTFDATGAPSPWAPPASFTTGPMRPSDWTAEWISSSAEKKHAVGGWRGYKSASSPTADAFKYIQFDFGREAIFDNVVIHPARPKDDPTGKGSQFPLRFRLYVDNSSAFDKKFMKAGEYLWQDLPDAGAEPFKFDTSRFKLRYLRVIVEKMQPDPAGGFSFAVGEIEVRDGTNNIAPSAIVTAGDALETSEWSLQAINDGQLYPGQPRRVQQQPATMMRKEFQVDSIPRHAWIAVSALGAYETNINGRPVGDARLAPGWTDYRTRVPYQMYDVAPLLLVGRNTWTVTLADAWYAGRLGNADQLANPIDRAIYGESTAFLGQMRIDDGSAAGRTVVTDATWVWSQSGVVRSADLFDGQVSDLRTEQRGWEAPGFDTAGWSPAVVVKPSCVPFAQVAPPVRALTPIPAVSVHSPRPNVFVYDFGQNLSGVVRVLPGLTKLGILQVRHAERVDDKGDLYLLNLRKAQQADRYLLREAWDGALESQFTVHGFRYVEITGRSEALPVTSVLAVPLTADVREVGEFECSEPTLNAIWRNSNWSRRSNYGAIPTDCPQRDERLGWTGDVLTFAGTALLQADLATYYTQWLRDLRGAQTEDGRFPDFAPNPYPHEDRWRGTPGWGDAGVFVPWELYLHYHDRQLLRASVDSMVRWVDHVQSKNPTLVWKDDRGSDYGDWLNGSTFEIPGWTKAGNDVPRDVFATAFFARSCELAAKAAFACERVKDAERLATTAKLARRAFRETFTDAAGVIQGDTQAGYALALDFDLFAEAPDLESRAVAHLARKLDESKGVLTTGFHATHRALLALSRYGRHDVAMRSILRREAPSFAAQIAAGATTTWERMDGFVEGRGCADPAMNSFNHVAFGAVCEWMMDTIAGIELPDDHLAFGTVTLTPILDGPTISSAEGPRAWEHVLLRPMIGSGVTWARAAHSSIAGRLSVSWKVEGDNLTYECTVPPNTRATLELPAASAAAVKEGGRSIGDSPALVARTWKDGRLPMDLGAGTYRFTSALR